MDQQTLKALYLAKKVLDIHVVSMCIREGRKGHPLSPKSSRSELGYADGQRAAHVLCRELYAQSVSPTFPTVLCSVISQ